MKYLAFVLDQDSRESLLVAVPPLFSKVIAHHVTIIFPRSKSEEDQMFKFYLALLDELPDVKVINSYVGSHIHAVGVALNDVVDRPIGGFYHVTVSLEPPAKPVDSNKLTSPTTLSPFSLNGAFQLI